MNRKSRKNAGPLVRDGELVKRICALRESLKANQRDFAAQIGASQTQVSEWERGEERPSVQKLIAMGNIALNSKDRMWFWRRAGYRESLVRGDLAEETALSMLVPDEAVTVEVPLAKKIFLGAAEELQIETEKSLVLPAQMFPAAPFVCALTVGKEESVAYLASRGDTLLVDRSPVNPDGLIDSMVAIFFEHRPESIDPGTSDGDFFWAMKNATYVNPEGLKRREDFDRMRDPEGFAAQQKANENTWARVEAYMGESVIRFGWLRLQPAGGRWEPRRPFAEQLSRVVLETAPSSSGNIGSSIPLTDWTRGTNPGEPKIERHIKRPVHIVGRIVGWFKQTSQVRVPQQEG